MIVSIIEKVYSFLWGDIIRIPLPSGGSLGISLLIILLIPTGVYFTIRTRFLPVRLFPDMVRSLTGKKKNENSLSTFQTLIVSTATRVGMGNLVGVVAAISAGGAGAVFWMWVTAIIGSSTAFVEATLAQLHKEEDPLYGGYRGGPAYYIHHFFEEKFGKKKKHVIIAVLFAISGLICWCGISQVISNSVASSFENAFGIPPIYTTVILVAIAAVIVLRRNATVKVLDVIVPIMAVCYFTITIFIIIKNIAVMPSVFERIFEEAFGIRQAAAGGFGAVLMNGIKRGLFSNEAGSGSAPCAAAAAECDTPVRAGLTQALGVFIDTIVICSCTAMIMLTAPQNVINGKEGMDLLQSAMGYHLGGFGVVFIAITLFLFSFSTFLGILFYARSNVAYLFGDKWIWQTLYKVLALVMLFIGGIAAYTFVWDLGDVGIGLMTIFNTGILYLLGGQAVKVLRDFEDGKNIK
ncbi:MAG: alanine:cation symporter family protein [Lachnobacterium sp.]|nr:alanine:cation symporter family protein [Lachnobacterium sp.]